MTSTPLFSVNNKQSADSGTPPQIDANTANRYHGYFENEYSEQLLFIYDYKTGKGTLYHGDLGWERPRPVEDGKAPSVVLNDAEALWLSACWLAATALRKSGE